MTAQTSATVDPGHMRQALDLAAQGLFTSMPNPRVGCVIAQGESVVGQGFHARTGEPHAEVFALRDAGDKARGATAYVTLEPCAHHGRTPPCADALIAAGVARVVMACEDPDPQVDGRGLAQLRDAGITVETGLLHEEARELNIGFFSRIERGRPFVRVKLAMSLDGRTALSDGTSKWITGEAARVDVQRWRARSSAIMTGSGTALADNPRLTVRLDDDTPFTAPLRVVLDRRLQLGPGMHLLDGSAPTVIFHAGMKNADSGYFSNVELETVATSAGGLDLHALMVRLAELRCNEVQVEAGPGLCGALFEAGLVDELLLYIAPVLLGDTARPLLHLSPLADMQARRRLRLVDQCRVGDDLRLRLRPQKRGVGNRE